MKELRHALALFTALVAKREAKEVGAMLQRTTPTRSLERVTVDAEQDSVVP